MNHWLPTPRRTVNALAGAAIMVVSFWVTPSLAGDPFRPSNPRNISDQTEAAFESIFKQGDYKTAKDYLQQAEASEGTDPLVYAMLAAIAYTERELETLNNYATKTRTTAEQLITSDPLRGNLYTAVGHFLEGTYNFEKEGPVRALSKLQKVFQYLDAAKTIDAKDPELNLLTGHMDLMLAVNVPFADPADAINKLETHGYPKYLAYRGIAVAYRDLKKYNQAMDYVERALAMTPDNPEVLYLKAQILVHQDQPEAALDYFEKALEKRKQLPNYSTGQIVYEQCKAQEEVDNINRDCRAERNRARVGNY